MSNRIRMVDRLKLRNPETVLFGANQISRRPDEKIIVSDRMLTLDTGPVRIVNTGSH
jgi:hypothetical protein